MERDGLLPLGIRAREGGGRLHPGVGVDVGHRQHALRQDEDHAEPHGGLVGAPRRDRHRHRHLLLRRQ